jgi:histone H3/H4
LRRGVFGLGFSNKSAVLKFCRSNKIRVATEFYRALDRKLESMLQEAIKRARANNRRTIMAQDV